MAPRTPPPEVLGRPAAHPGRVLHVGLQPTHRDAPRVRDRAVVLQNTDTTGTAQNSVLSKVSCSEKIALPLDPARDS